MMTTAPASSPGVPENLLAWPADQERTRLGLANWLLDERNPLTSRVAVNQMWYLVFGRGLVETVEDFGNQGRPAEPPRVVGLFGRRLSRERLGHQTPSANDGHQQHLPPEQ